MIEERKNISVPLSSLPRWLLSPIYCTNTPYWAAVLEVCSVQHEAAVSSSTLGRQSSQTCALIRTLRPQREVGLGGSHRALLGTLADRPIGWTVPVVLEFSSCKLSLIVSLKCLGPALFLHISVSSRVVPSTIFPIWSYCNTHGCRAGVGNVPWAKSVPQAYILWLHREIPLHPTKNKRLLKYSKKNGILSVNIKKSWGRTPTHPFLGLYDLHY